MSDRFRSFLRDTDIRRAHARSRSAPKPSDQLLQQSWHYIEVDTVREWSWSRPVEARLPLRRLSDVAVTIIGGPSATD